MFVKCRNHQVQTLKQIMFSSMYRVYMTEKVERSTYIVIVLVEQVSIICSHAKIP
jgi:tRNA splicing endonuclease